MKKPNKSTIILVIVFLLGLALLLYPTVSDWWNNQVQSRAIVNYDETVANMSKADYEAEFAKADEYNQAIAKLANPLVSYEQVEGYEDTLNIMGTGMMGYIEIPRIRVKLPIYHGTSDAVLNTAVGHLEGSSLPVGGEGTHCVLSAHRGLPSSLLFTDLDKLVEGDTFSITVLDRLLTYQVDQIRIVEPDEVGELAIQEGKDYCTLLTCTPYGINTHRLLVRGHRIENPIDEGLQTEAYELDPLVLAPIIAGVLLLALLVALLIRRHRSKMSG